MTAAELVPFQPLGESARWHVLYDKILRKAEIGGLVTYVEMGDALSLHPVDDRQLIRVALRRAAKEYLEVDLRALEVVRGVGYRVVEPSEQLRLAHLQGRKARRSVGRGQVLTHHVDLSLIGDPETRKAFETVANGFAAVADLMKRVDARQGRVEQAVATVTTRQERSDDELAALRARLDRLEHQLP